MTKNYCETLWMEDISAIAGNEWKNKTAETDFIITALECTFTNK